MATNVLDMGLLGRCAAVTALTSCLTAVEARAYQAQERVERTAHATEAKRERLLKSVDSLRREIEHRRLTAMERTEIARELAGAIRELTTAFQGSWNIDTAGGMRVMVREGRETHGYMGASFDAPSSNTVRNNERILRFFQYPRIETVDPDSPAERAGLQAGDTMITLNGIDVGNGRPISLTRALVPGQTITVRVRRDGAAKDLTMTVGEKRPAYVVARVSAIPPGRPVPAATRFPAREGTRPAVRGASPVQRRIWVSSTGVAGARVETLSQGLGKAVGVEKGVLVIQATPGTPAYQSGLRDGDVIVKANDEPVREVGDLSRALADGERADGVRLVIFRERRERTLTLRW